MNRMMYPTLLGSALLACAASAAIAADETPSVDEIVRKADYVSYYQGADGRAHVNMTIVDSQNRERKREFTILRRDQQEAGAVDADFIGDQKFYVYFRRPADVNKMVFMVWKHLDKPDDRWLYQPALDNVARISAADQRTSFAGSHFFYEDVSGRHIDADEHELVETTDNYYVLKNTPQDKSLVEFTYYKMWIHKATFVVVKTEYYDKPADANGKDPEPYRVYEARELKTIDGFPTVTKARMTDHRIGGHTDMEYTTVQYNVDLPDDLFTERYLRRAPKQYLQ